MDWKAAELVLLGAGLVDEGIRLQELLKEHDALLKQVASATPTCPHCRTTLEPRRYRGYYESFSYWECECGGFPKEREWKGCYA